MGQGAAIARRRTDKAKIRLETRNRMRPSKSRSRNKSNRSRSVGNIVNRVFDSSGPEGKVRGTPQQIIDKYNQLARDAHLSNDRVAAENFQQHAEHYARLLGEAQREQDARREQQEAQNRERNRDRAENDAQQQDGAPVEETADAPVEVSAEVIDLPQDEGESTLVETPEEKPAPKPRRPRKPRAPKAQTEPAPEAQGGDAPEAKVAEAPDAETPKDQPEAPAAE